MPRNEIYFPQIISLILESVRNILNKSMTVDFWETLSNEQKDDILQGIKEIENGEVVDYEEFMSKHR
jgi:AAA15 family ATPase/GTPase